MLGGANGANGDCLGATNAFPQKKNLRMAIISHDSGDHSAGKTAF